MATGGYSTSDEANRGSKSMRRINLVFLGEKQAGKTALINRFMHDTAKDNMYSVDVDSSSKTLTVQNHGLQLHLFDTSGAERSRDTICGYIRHSTVFLVVYDVTDAISFEHTPKWVDVVRSEHGNDSIIVLCGNKIELADKREVSTAEGERKAKELNTMFIETSAVAGPNVTILFRNVVAAILNMDSNSGDGGASASGGLGGRQLSADTETDCTGCSIA